MSPGRVHVGDVVKATSRAGLSVAGVVVDHSALPTGELCLGIQRRGEPPLWLIAVNVRVLRIRDTPT